MILVADAAGSRRAPSRPPVRIRGPSSPCPARAPGGRGRDACPGGWGGKATRGHRFGARSKGGPGVAELRGPPSGLRSNRKSQLCRRLFRDCTKPFRTLNYALPSSRPPGSQMCLASLSARVCELAMFSICSLGAFLPVDLQAAESPWCVPSSPAGCIAFSSVPRISVSFPLFCLYPGAHSLPSYPPGSPVSRALES